MLPDACGQVVEPERAGWHGRRRGDAAPDSHDRLLTGVSDSHAGGDWLQLRKSATAEAPVKLEIRFLAGGQRNSADKGPSKWMQCSVHAG